MSYDAASHAAATGAADARAGRPANPPFTRHLATAYSVAYAKAKAAQR